jgi:hypothetical protein
MIMNEGRRAPAPRGWANLHLHGSRKKLSQLRLHSILCFGHHRLIYKNTRYAVGKWVHLSLF